MENVVKYKIFIKDGESFVSERDLEARLANYLVFLSPLINDFIWQNESFHLVVRPDKGDVPAHLYGKTNFGDNVGDEWFVVSLLYELSRVFPETCISISDNDGEFLLIEAAHFLPRWLNPDNSKNRVFVYKGKLHIIPIPSTPGELIVFPTGTPTVCQALQLVFSVHKTEAAAKIQDAVNQRIIGKLSKQSQNTFHYAHCYVPVEVKCVLDQKPSLISPIVQAFFERDAADIKACRKMDQFLIKTRLMARICFTRCLYAQLSQQPFKPYKESEWPLPPPSHTEFQAHELGHKLACGFQILCMRSEKEEVNPKEESFSVGPLWEKFLACLKEQGYFKGEVDGSKLHQELFRKAQKQFSEQFATEDRPSPGETIRRILKDATIDLEKMKTEDLLPADDDSWLNLSEDDLQGILSQYSHPNSSMNGTECGTKAQDDQRKDETAVDLESVTSSLKSFVDKVSSYEGAEFPGDRAFDDIEFDADSFVDTVGKILGQAVDSKSESDDEEMTDSDMTSSSDDERREPSLESSSRIGDGDMLTYMEQMDAELARTSIGDSFEKRTSQAEDLTSQGNRQTQEDVSGAKTHEEDEGGLPVDVDFNLVKNILESFSTQQGLAGPASNILNSMGVWLPPDKDVTQLEQ